VVRLKAGALAKPNATAPRFTGTITCYTDPATGLVTGLKLGSATPICSTTGTARTVTVPADGAVVGVVASIDPKTGLLGKLVLAVDAPNGPTASLVQCGGTAGGVPVSALPKLAALSSLAAGCAPLPATGGGRRRALAASGVAVDAATLTVTSAPLTAAGGGGSVTLLSNLVSTAAQLAAGALGIIPGSDAGTVFTTSASPVTINTVVLPLAYFTTAGTCTVSIQTVAGGVPTGTVVGTPVTAAVPTQQPATTHISFTGLGAPVAPSTQYAFVVSCTAGTYWMADPAVIPALPFTGSFTSGNLVLNQGGWSSGNPVELYGIQFKITS